MASTSTSLGLLADFNVQNFVALLQKGGRGSELHCVSGPFGQTINLLLDPKAEFWLASYEALVLWTLPERAIPTFGKVLLCEEYDQEDLLKEVDAFAGMVERIPGTVRTVFIPSWTAPAAERGWGTLDLTVGVANALMRMNLQLAARLEKNRRVVLLDAQRWLTADGVGAYNPKLWYLSKTPFDVTVFQEAAGDLLAALDGIRGRSKKMVVLDLDDTLWGGVVGDVGWQNLRLGGHDPAGEAFVDFQKALKRLMRRGIILSIVSKNEEAVALEAIREHPEMILRIDDFAGWRINWQDKAQNLIELVSELNLGMDSVVFLDDSPFERARVREALPQVLVPDLPNDPMRYPSFLSRMKCFDNPSVSSEDRSRTRMYVADRARTESRKQIESLNEWLAMLGLGVAVEPLSAKNLERAAQLFNKTNQMNLSTRRLSVVELLTWAQAEGHTLWTFRVWDRFGDYGLCGIGSLVRDGTVGQIVDFLLSCRVMGRGVEDAMLAALLQRARESGCDTVWVDYAPTAKNLPCKKWLYNLTAVAIEGNRLTFSLNHATAFPAHIKMSLTEVNERICV
jgi:FkbH-like protein